MGIWFYIITIVIAFVTTIIIARVAFLKGQNSVYNDIAARTAGTEKEVEKKTAEVDKQSATIKALQVKINQKHISSQE